MNSVNLIGRLVADSELRFTPNGTAVANFRLAVNGAGEFISEAEGYGAGFFNIVVWGQQAEAVANHCHKGREVGISGQLQQRTWDGDDNVRHYVVEVVAKRVDFLRDVQGAQQQEPPQQQQQRTRNNNRRK